MPLSVEKENDKIFIHSYRDDIENYDTKKDLGIPGITKAIKLR